MSDLTAEQMFRAMQAISPCGKTEASIRFRGGAPATQWYVSLRYVTVRSGAVEEQRHNRGGSSTVEAVYYAWKGLTELKEHEYLVVREPGAGSQHPARTIKWNGFMWEDVEINTAAPAPK